MRWETNGVTNAEGMGKRIIEDLGDFIKIHVSKSAVTKSIDNQFMQAIMDHLKKCRIIFGVKMIFDDLRLMKASLDGVIMNKLVLFPLRKLFILLLLPGNAFYALDVLSRFGCSLNAIIAFLSCARPIGTLWGHNRSRVLYE
ncbi:hypothetical protein SCA6_017570 [Theobroma cacao]